MPRRWEQFGAMIGEPGERAIARLLDGTTTGAPPLELDSPNWERGMKDGALITAAPELKELLEEWLTRAGCFDSQDGSPADDLTRRTCRALDRSEGAN